MERMTALLRSAAALLVLGLAVSCEDMVVRDTVVKKVAAAQAASSPGGQAAVVFEATPLAFQATHNLPVVKAGTSPEFHFTLRNTGLGPLTGNSVSLDSPTGTGGTFAVTAQPATALVGGGTSDFTLTFTAAAGTGTAGVSLRVTTSDPTHPVFTVTLAARTDGTAPTGSFTINSGAATTATAAVTLNLSADDVGGGTVTQMQFSNDNVTYTAPEAYSATKAYTLADASQGTKTIWVRFLDSLGNTSAPVSQTILMSPPQPALSLVYSSSAVKHQEELPLPVIKTSTQTVLHFTLRNTGEANLTNNFVSILNPTGSGGNFAVTTQPTSPLVPTGSSNFDVTFTAGAATGTASATLQIESNDPTHPAFTVTLTAQTDGNAPTGSLSVSGGAALTNSATVTLTLAGNDTGGAGVSQMQFSNDNATYTAPEAYSTTKAGYTLPNTGTDGLKTVYVKFIDSVGNVSAPISDTITLDTTKPTASFAVTPSNGSYATQQTGVSVTFSEAMQTGTLTASSVRLLLGGSPVTLQAGTNGFSANSTNVILRPATNLRAATTYTVQVTTAALDAAGNAIQTYNGTFTTDNDPYENTWTGTGVGSGYDNNSVAHAFDLSDVYGWDGGGNPWTPGTYNLLSQEMDNVGVSGLAMIPSSTDVDYYTFSVTPGEILDQLRIRVFYSNNGTTVAAAGTDVLGVAIGFRPTSTGTGVTPPYTWTLTGQYEKEITVDLTAVTSGTGLPLDDGIYTISVYSNTFGSRRTYNVEWEKHYNGM